eukprot:1542302-Heterocapsa_arctica.AAC.1
MELAPPEMLSNLRVEPGKKVFLATGDIANCFYQFGLPVPLQDYFCMPELSYNEAKEVGLSHDTRGRPLDPYASG